MGLRPVSVGVGPPVCADAGPERGASTADAIYAGSALAGRPSRVVAPVRARALVDALLREMFHSARDMQPRVCRGLVKASRLIKARGSDHSRLCTARRCWRK